MSGQVEANNNDAWKNSIGKMPGGMGVYYVYPDDRVELVYRNDAFYKMLDTTREAYSAYAGFHALEAVEGDDHAQLIAALRRAIREDVEVNLDVRALLGSGQTRWMNVRATVAEQLADKALVYMLFSSAELQKEAEARYERESRLRKELIKDAVISFRVNLNTAMVEECYSAARDLSDFKFPIPMEALLQIALQSCYEPDRPKLRKMLDPAAMLANYEAGKRGESFSFRSEFPGKGQRWLKASIAKLKRVNTDEVIAFFTAIDIDEDKKDQILFRDVMDEEIEGLLTLQVATYRMRIIKDNRPLKGYVPGTESSGYLTIDAELAADFYRDVLPEDLSGAKAFTNPATIEARLAENPILQHTYRTTAPDGTLRHKKVRAFYLDESRQDIIFVRRDITDLYLEQQRQNEAIQHAMDEAKSANEAKSVFLSRMSHDMRTPLNAIIGYSGPTLREGASEQQKDAFLDDIHASGAYLLGIINDVLDMTKIESNKMVLHPEPYASRDFCNNINTVIRPLCEKKDVHFTIDLDEEGEKSVLLDKVRFNQIFVNILSNAVKFTPAGGSISLTSKMTPRPDGLMDAVFAVADTGCGMSKEYLPHAFDSFSQEYNAHTTHNEQGTGLGLSIVKQLVELMGGQIAVESTLGVGTTFTVSMPLQPARSEQSDEAPDFPQGGLCGLHLLLCEDHPTNRKIAVMLLQKEGCTVDCAEDGALGVAAFEKAAPGSYDAVLMDIRMPNMGGLEAARAIRALPRADAATVPIIAMTANAFVEDRRASLAAGMNAHVAKPIDPDELYRTIYRFTKGNQVARKQRVLVVDDRPEFAMRQTFALADAYETRLAACGHEALEQLERDPYIVALLIEVPLPDMPADELVRRIRCNPDYNHIGVIANLGESVRAADKTLHGTKAELEKAGVDLCVAEGIAPARLCENIARVVEKRR